MSHTDEQTSAEIASLASDLMQKQRSSQGSSTHTFMPDAVKGTISPQAWSQLPDNLKHEFLTVCLHAMVHIRKSQGNSGLGHISWADSYAAGTDGSLRLQDIQAANQASANGANRVQPWSVLPNYYSPGVDTFSGPRDPALSQVIFGFQHYAAISTNSSLNNVSLQWIPPQQPQNPFRFTQDIQSRTGIFTLQDQMQLQYLASSGFNRVSNSAHMDLPLLGKILAARLCCSLTWEGLVDTFTRLRIRAIRDMEPRVGNILLSYLNPVNILDPAGNIPSSLNQISRTAVNDIRNLAAQERATTSRSSVIARTQRSSF